jgi:hypothetical protein
VPFASIFFLGVDIAPRENYGAPLGAEGVIAALLLIKLKVSIEKDLRLLALDKEPFFKVRIYLHAPVQIFTRKWHAHNSCFGFASRVQEEHT